MLSRRRVVEAAGRYLRRHPEEFSRAVRSAFGLRVGVPIVAFRWLVDQMSSDPSQADVEIDAKPPGLGLAGTFENMKTLLRGSATVFIDRVEVGPDRMRVEVRLEDVNLRVLSAKKTHLSALVKSGALDVSKPGNLVAELPDMPATIVEAYDNVIVLDLMKDPKLAGNRLVYHALGLLSSMVTLHGIETDPTHLDVVLRALPNGVGAAADAVEEHVLEPSVRKIRGFLASSTSASEDPPRRSWRRMLGGLSERIVA